MASHRRPLPLLATVDKPRPLCPVCGSVSYSVAGIHPQCSAAQFDRERMQRLRSLPAAEAPDALAPGQTHFPDNMEPRSYYEPVPRGLELKLRETLDRIRRGNAGVKERNDDHA